MNNKEAEKSERREGWREGVEAAAGVYKRALTVPKRASAVPEPCPSQPDVWQQKVWDKLNTIETLLREQGKSG